MESGCVRIIEEFVIQLFLSVMITLYVPAGSEDLVLEVSPSDQRYLTLPTLLTGVTLIVPVLSPAQLMFRLPWILTDGVRVIPILPGSVRLKVPEALHWLISVI